MKLLRSILMAGGAFLAVASAAHAADLPTKKGAAPAPEKPNCYATFWGWLDSTPSDCPLSYWGITFYGQIDVAGGYETHAAKFDKYFNQGVQELISKQSHGPAWQFVPNGLSQSNVGIKWKEQVAPDWFFIGDVNFGFDPYSLTFADSPRSLAENNTINPFYQSANGDSSRAYGPINTRAYAGISNKTLGTLTYGRQYSFSNENANIYDPFGGAYAFSLIGNSTTLGGGLGDTELARFNNSIKYVYADHNIRAGVLSEVGGWDAGNNAQYAIQGDVGFDYQGLSVDGVYMYAKDAVSLATFGKPVGPAPSSPPTDTTLKATIQDMNSGQIAAKYKWNQFTFYGGWQIEDFKNPSDLPANFQIRKFNDGFDAVYGAAVQGANNFPKDRIQQVLWIGSKYNVLPNVDLAFGYYHVWQNDYLGATEKSTDCQRNTSKDPNGAPLKGANSGKCAGNEDAISGVVDWRPYKRLDVYAGAMYSKVRDGLASGFFANDNLAFTGGLRVSF